MGSNPTVSANNINNFLYSKRLSIGASLTGTLEMTGHNNQSSMRKIHNPRIMAAMILAVNVTFALSAQDGATAQTRAAFAAPMPPPRPAQTSVMPPPEAQQPVMAKPTNNLPLNPNSPPMLPSASRTRMRDCGVKWEEMKMTGKDVSAGWRTFATACLTSKT